MISDKHTPIRHANIPDATIHYYIGPNYRYFLFKWKFAGIFSQWNWAAFLSGPFWFIYRKHYFWSIALAGLYLLADFFYTTNPYHFTFVIELMLLSGFFANIIHLAKLKSWLKKNNYLKNSGEPQVRNLRAFGGALWYNPVLLFVGLTLLTLILPSVFGIHLFQTRVIRADITSIVYTFFKPDSRWQEFERLRKDYQLAYVQGDFKKSIALNQNTLKLCELKYGKNHHFTIALQSELITHKLKAGNHRDAQRLTEELIKLYRVRFGPEHLFVVFMLNNLAANYIYQGLYDQAKIQCNNCLLMLEKYKQNFKHPVILNNLAMLYSNIGFIYQAYCDYEQAEKYHQEALSLTLAAAKGYTTHTCAFLERLGDFYLEQMKLDQAQKYYAQAKEIAEQTLGSRNPLLSTIYLGLGKINFLQHHPGKALGLIQHAHSINETYYGFEHIYTAQTACQLGRIYFSQGKLYEAETWLHKSLAITEKAIGNNNAVYADYLNHISGLYIFRNNYEAAEKALLQATRIITAIYGKNHPRLLIPLEQLVEVYEKTDRPKTKLRYELQMQEILKKSPGRPASDKIFKLDADDLAI